MLVRSETDSEALKEALSTIESKTNLSVGRLKEAALFLENRRPIGRELERYLSSKDQTVRQAATASIKSLASGVLGRKGVAEEVANSLLDNVIPVVSALSSGCLDLPFTYDQARRTLLNKTFRDRSLDKELSDLISNEFKTCSSIGHTTFANDLSAYSQVAGQIIRSHSQMKVKDYQLDSDDLLDMQSLLFDDMIKRGRIREVSTGKTITHAGVDRDTLHDILMKGLPSSDYEFAAEHFIDGLMAGVDNRSPHDVDDLFQKVVEKTKADLEANSQLRVDENGVLYSLGDVG